MPGAAASTTSSEPRRGLNLASAPAGSPALFGGGGGQESGDEMCVQTQAMQILVCLTPSAQSPTPLNCSTRRQHGQEGLNFG